MKRHGWRDAGRRSRVPLALVAAVLAVAVAGAPLPAGGSPPPGASTAAARLPRDASLSSVSCPAGGSCYAVGNRLGSVEVGGAPLVVAIGRRSVTAVRVPVPPGALVAQLWAVSCATRSSCVAVGQTTDVDGGEERAFAEVLRAGRWTISPTAHLAFGATLQGISCLSATDCVAVGDQNYGSSALAERYDGRSWRVVPTSSPGSGLNELISVSCRARTSCVAAGASGSVVLSTLAERLDGRRFVATRTLDPSNGGNGFEGVWCTARRACVAVGTAPSDGGQGDTLVEAYDGVGWRLEASPSPIVGHPLDRVDVLEGVDCTAASFCLAVGVSGYGGAIADTFGGRTWRAADPTHQPAQAYLIGDSCTGRRSCVAVGFTSPGGGGKQRPVVYRLSGRRWSLLSP